MIRFTLTTTLALPVLLLCGGLSPGQATDTKIVIKDGGSIILSADGLDAGANWKVSKTEVRHRNSQGLLSGLRITEAGADRCAGDPKCGIDLTQHWTIQINYGASSVTVASVSTNKGVRVRFSRDVTLDHWLKTTNGDERVFGHGDGKRITGIEVNNGPNLCAEKTGCELTLIYTTP